MRNKETGILEELKTNFLGSFQPFSKINWMVNFLSVYLGRLRDQKNVSLILYIETMPSLVSLRGVRIEEEVL